MQDNAEIYEVGETTMKTFKCEEMMCDHCVSRIHNALEEASVKHSVDLGSKTVTIDGDDSVVKNAVEILDDLGFSAVEA